MFKQLFFIVKLFIYWITIFLVFRIVFLFLQLPWNDGASVTESLSTLYHALRLDTAVTCYLLIIPFIIWAFNIFIKNTALKKIHKIYHVIVLSIVILIGAGNLIVYQHWGTLINNRAVAFLTDPAEVIASASWGLLIGGTSLLIIIYFAFIRIFLQYINKAETPVESGYFQRSVSVFATLAFIVIGLRGGLQQIPINESAAYFSSNRTLNHIATNPLWSLGSSLKLSSVTNSNPYIFMDNADAREIVDNLLNKGKAFQTNSILKESATKPNVIIVILESWTADIIESLNGESGVTPNFDKYQKQGLLFSNIYSSGFRTDQGLTSILSGFPAQPNKSIIRFPEKTQRLPSLSNSFKAIGYSNSFYYGGELGFANMRSYLLSQGFDKIISKDDFNSEDMNSKWGAHDGIVFERMHGDLTSVKEPFFSVILTLSTHEPFEVPMNTPFNGSDDPDKFRKSAYYTDFCLGKFLDQLKTQPFYDNTVILLVADHGHMLPKQRNYYDPLARRIPLLITGGALKPEFKGKVNDHIGAQHDIPATLLDQMDLNSSKYTWSNNLLNSSRHDFAYLSQDNAFTFITQGNIYSKDISLAAQRKDSEVKESDVTLQRSAEAYLQCVFEDFINY